VRDDRPEALTRPEALDPPQTADWPRQDTGPGPTELSRRLDSLPDGHPSSRYEADGALRRPPVRLTDLETPPAEDTPTPDLESPSPDGLGRDDPEATDASRPDDVRPLTDSEWADHITEVRDRLKKAFDDGLATDNQYTIDPRGEIWSDGRAAAHDTIIDNLIARSGDIPSEHKAIIAGGLGGAGKSTVLGNYAGIDRSQYLTINPDNIKEEMASWGVVPDVECLTPMEASALAHEEASYIAKQIAIRARAEGMNIIWDITMSSYENTERRIDELRTSGYDQIDGIFVDIPIEASVARADSRHRSDHEQYRIGEGLGGRLVPPEVTLAQADEQWGSQNRKTFEAIKNRFDSWSRYDNAVDGRAPLLVEASMPHDYEHEEASQ